MSISKIKKQSLVADAIDATKIANDSISEEHLDVTAITDQTLLDETANESDILLIYDASAGTLKKVLKSNVSLQPPVFTSISPTTINESETTTTFTITGENLLSGSTATLLTSGGSEVSFDSVTRDSNTQLTCVLTNSNTSNANEPYGVKITSGNGLAITSAGQVNFNAAPVFVTSAGSLGSNRFSMSSVSVNATDPESAGNVTFELQSGSLPPGISIVNTAAEGGTATFTGTISPLASSDTVYNFTLRAVDATSNTNSRAFSFTAQGPTFDSFTSSGTFAVPSGTTSVTTLVVAGGGGGPRQHASGGGAGGLVYMPGFPVTPGGTITVTVGCGGAEGPGPGGAYSGQDSVFGSPGDPGLGCGGVLTAKGGGAGGHYTSGPTAPAGSPGGSGGGAGVDEGSGVNSNVGTATQPTQPGNSGAYGFGNAGGQSNSPAPFRGGGGGGAGAAGGNYEPNKAGNGGAGKAYTIADGTTPVYYAGGGGGGAHNDMPGGSGGQGGGGDGNGYGGGPLGSGPGGTAQPGTANRGGGGGSSSCSGATAGSGGKGIVIVEY